MIFTKGQIIKYYGSTITLIERVQIPDGEKLVPFWVYVEQKGAKTNPALTPESDLIELFSESLAS